MSSLEDPAFVSPSRINLYLETLVSKGCAEVTINSYRRNLGFFYRDLPKDKLIQPNTLEDWRHQMIEKGYTIGTINHRLTTVNGYLDYVGLRNYQAAYLCRDLQEQLSPELSRHEYLRLLSTAKLLGRQRTYLLIKTIVATGLAVHELSCLTLEAVKAGTIRVTKGNSHRVVQIPLCVKEELLSYARKKQLSAGPIFVTRNGMVINRSNVSLEIQTLACCRISGLAVHKAVDGHHQLGTSARGDRLAHVGGGEGGLFDGVGDFDFTGIGAFSGDGDRVGVRVFAFWKRHGVVGALGQGVSSLPPTAQIRPWAFAPCHHR